MSIHKLLAKQLEILEINPHQPPSAEVWEKLIETVNLTYQKAETTNKSLYGELKVLEKRLSSQLLPGTDNRDLLGTVFETMGDGMCTLNVDGRLILMNPQAEKMLGWDQSEIHGELILDAIYPIGSESLSPTQRLFLKLQRHKEIDFPEAIFRTSTGHILNVSFSLSAITHRDKFAGAVLVFRDISTILHTQAELSHQLEQTLLLNRVIGALTSTLEANDILETLCRELCEFLGLPHVAFALVEKPAGGMKIVAECIADNGPSSLGMVITVNDKNIKEKVFKSHRTLFLSGNPAEDEINLREFDLRRGTISLMIIPIIVRGEVVGTLGLNASKPRHFDETELDLVQNIAGVAGRALENAILYKDLQHELNYKESIQMELVAARDEAEEANTFKSQLLAKVSHELRTPLSSILGFAEMLELGIYGQLDQNQIEVLRQVIQASEHLVVLVNDLLDISRLEAGKLSLAQAEFSIHNLLDRIERDMRRLAVNKGLNLQIFLDQELPTILYGDIDRIHQVLNNLIGNGIKYTNEGRVEVHLRANGAESWTLTIRDTGIGIPYEMQAKIFDHFQQGNLENYEKSLTGFGLGLAIVKQLVHLMDGEITLQSAPNQGSTFSVKLPLKPSQITLQQTVTPSVENRVTL